MASPGGITSGDQILSQQMKPRGFTFGPTPGGIYGGGNSPVRQREVVSPNEFGQLAMWSGDGYIAVTTTQYAPEAPADGLVYGRRGYDHQWIPVASNLGVPEAPVDGRSYTRDGQFQAWLPLPFIIPEAPPTGQPYNRYGSTGTWGLAFSKGAADALYAPIATVGFPEAPDDGIAYARRGWDRRWIPVATNLGVSEAPPTGNTYVRDGLNEAWRLSFTQAQATALFAPISITGSIIPEAPADGQDYVRNGLLRTWQPAFTEAAAVTLFAPIWTVSFPEAPVDGRSYLRRGADHSWQAMPVIQNWITEALDDGQLYVRDGLLQTWVSVQTLDLDGGTYP